MVKASIGVLVLAAAMAVSACNTVSGAGRDLQSASEAGREAIN